MSRKRIIYIAMALGLLIGNGLLFGSWFFPTKDLDAQCTRVYLSNSASNPPPCPGGTIISSTQSAINSAGAYSSTQYISLCIQ